MSRRKQHSIKAAAAQAAKKQKAKQNWWRRASRSTGWLGIGICLLLALGAVGAAATANRSSNAGNPNSDSLFGKLFPTKSTTAPAAPLPTPSPTPQLSKEYLYAGSRMLAVEDAGTATSNVQPADLVVWRPASGTWFIKDSGKDGLTGTGVFGTNGDKPVQGDFDGDGLYDFSGLSSVKRHLVCNAKWRRQLLRSAVWVIN